MARDLTLAPAARAGVGAPRVDRDRRRLFTLDCVRGIAALLVCMQHLRTATLVDYPQLASPRLLDSALYFVTNLGHESVMVFFVLSGFFVGGSVVRAGAAFRWSDYLLARSLRLWCVLIPSLLLTFVCDRWLMAQAPGVLNGEYLRLWHSVPPPGAYDASWVTALGNAFFLQTVWVPVYGSNGPLWSLANEAWYYLLFPLLYTALRTGAAGQRIVLAAGAALLLAAMPASMRWLFAVWLLGVGVHALDRRRVGLPRGALSASAGMFLGALLLSRLHLIPSAWDPTADCIVGITFAALCLVLTRRDAALRVPERLCRVASWLSDISFSLYLSHFPLVLIIAAAGQDARRAPPDLAGLLAFVGWLALLLVAGHAMWWCFERRTPALRAWIRRWPTGQRAVRD